MELKLFAGNANPELAKEIAKYLQQPLGKIKISHFKDGEVYVAIEENVRGCDVFVIQPTSKYVNHNLMELAIIIDALKRASANRITAVMPYYGYARQDRKAKPREPITARLVANIITTAGADRVLTLDLHSGQIQGFFDIPVDNLTAAPMFAEYFKKENIDKITVVSPDAGGVKKARSLASMLDNAPLAIIDKRREKHNEIAEMNVVGDVKGRNCILIDDMIDTAGTISEAAKALKQHKAKDVYVCATHAILSDPAKERLDSPDIKKVVLTNSIAHTKEELPSKVKILSVGPLIGESIKRINKNQSLSELNLDFVTKSTLNKMLGE